MSEQKDQPQAASPDSYQVGYGKPPKQAQFKKGQSGNPKGRPRATEAHMPVSRIIRRSLSEEIKVHVNGKQRKMTRLEAVIEMLFAMVRKGDLRAAKMLIDLGHKHIAPHQTLAELMGDRPLFTFTKEEAAKFSKKKLMEGIVFDDHEDDEGGQPVL
ncbi:DUF5681 domain-containing protein [Reyranella soli]|uniref:DUF5681 domain-containing protein n=1 Tax=Reyranella soli TaxID=1230389 RepID=A0A512NQS4_9HYPH|nr:DUF5681 domain-containing protein [Reyranella soli]GEP61300.1 hypothetical protein RSO01_84660 [Reyranella soli]